MVEKKRFTVNNTINFEVSRDAVVEGDLTFKEAIDKGYIRVVNSSVTLISEDGRMYDDPEYLDIIKDAIIYGLMEKA